MGLTPALFAESIGVMSYNIHRGGVIHKKQPLSDHKEHGDRLKISLIGWKFEGHEYR